MLLDMLKAFTPKSLSFQLFHADKILLRSGFVLLFFLGFTPIKGTKLQEKEAQKRNLFRKNLQLIGVCQF